jgi:hypothetical protein
LFMAANEGVTTEIGMENATNLESLSTELRCVELGRWVAEFVLQHSSVEVIRLKSAITDLQRQLPGQNHDLCMSTNHQRMTRG